MNDDAEIPLRLRIVRSPERDGGDQPLVVDQSIPMLTEVMDFQPINLDDTEKLAIPSFIADKAIPIDLQELKQNLQNNILESLLEKSDAFLAREFQERVMPLVERTVNSMVQDLHIHLEQVLRDAVASAITDELNKLQLSKPNDLSR
jgi:hypothetical protein